MIASPNPTLKMTTPAKVNLALAVDSPRAGDGYHPIASWMVAVHFGDRLTLTRLTDGRDRTDLTPSRFDIDFAPDAPQPQAVDWPLEKDLAFRAHALMQETLSRTLPVHCVLEKWIPAGAGLAGGSGNAAGMLTGLNQLFELKMPFARLMRLAGSLGADVSFVLAAMHGQPSALVGGVGELITPLPPRAQPLHLVLILPPLTCHTPALYQAFDQTIAQGGHTFRADAVHKLISTEILDSSALFNDLAQPAMAVAPALTQLSAQLETKLGHRVHVTGSGAALFVVCCDQEQATTMAHEITACASIPAVATRTLQG